MIKRCIKTAEEKLLNYLSNEAVFNTFMIADILNYGFEQEFQSIYADIEEDSISGVYLKFYENLIVYSHLNRIDRKFMKEWLQDFSPAVIMGKAKLVSVFQELLPSYQFAQKSLYILKEEKFNAGIRRNITIRAATLADVDKIYDFLMTIEEIKGLYGSKEMIENRIRTGDGIHYLVEEDGEIIGHANSTASNPYTVMIGGVATALDARSRGIARNVVAVAAKEILAQGKTPCLFCREGTEDNLFIDLGFERAGEWAVLERN